MDDAGWGCPLEQGTVECSGIEYFEYDLFLPLG